MPAPDKTAKTFFAVYKLIENYPDRHAIDRSEIMSGVKRFWEICGIDPHSTVADPATIRRCKGRANWQEQGISKGRWENIKSDVSKALDVAGIVVHRRRTNYALSGTWSALLVELDKIAQRDLHRFAGWCSALKVDPRDVTRETFLAFLDYCMNYMTHRNPRERWHVARRAWNRGIVKGKSLGYPEILSPEPPVWRGLRWEELPESLRSDFLRYAEERKPKKLFKRVKVKGKRALKPITLAGYETKIRLFATCLVEAGISANSLTSLAVLVAPENIELGLEQHVRDDEPEKAASRVSAMAIALRSVARTLHALDEISEVEMKQVVDVTDEVIQHPKGMCKKNWDRLTPFKKKRAVKALLRLPTAIFERLGNISAPTVRQAQDAQMAALLALLIRAPVRISNAAALDFAKHVSRQDHGNEIEWVLRWLGSEVKNGVELNHRIKGANAMVLERYVATFRPALTKHPTTALFIGQNGKQKCAAVLAKQLQAFIRREIGYTFNPHLIRHLIAYLYLKVHPGRYVTVQRLLGHKNVQTTINFYCGFEEEADHERLDALIDGLVADKASNYQLEDVL